MSCSQLVKMQFMQEGSQRSKVNDYITICDQYCGFCPTFFRVLYKRDISVLLHCLRFWTIQTIYFLKVHDALVALVGLVATLALVALVALMALVDLVARVALVAPEALVALMVLNHQICQVGHIHQIQI